MKINLIILTINTYIIYKSGQLIYSANKVISLYKQDYPIVYFVPNRTVIKKKKQTIRRNKEVKSKLIKKVIKNVFSNILNHPYYLCFSKNQITSTYNSFNLSKSSSVIVLSVIIAFANETEPKLAKALTPIFEQSATRYTLLADSIIADFTTKSLRLG